MQYHNPTVEECEAGDLVAVLQDMKAQGKPESTDSYRWTA